MIEFNGRQYHVTYAADVGRYDQVVEVRWMDDPSAQVLVRVSGWYGSDELEVETAPAVDQEVRAFAVRHAKDLMGEDLD
jgi:hypothetical protein